ncbi:hypothetical protein OsccyDRAFT_5080 [Leptolyngbyaceae cyanobacterium JSC-12]|nr:hypothetical protein OsccyDRAFT_5080 [Leptolyngbyaceae cyanobacterium JSC-12]
MSFQPTPKQALVMWSLLITGDEPAISKVRPELKPAERKPLIDFGLIELVKRGRSTHIVLTDKAWDWAAGHFEVELSKSNYAVPILQELLKKLGSYLNSHKIPLVEFLVYKNTTIEHSESGAAVLSDLGAKIREAYLQASGGEYNVRVRLSQLRQLVDDLPQAEVDKVLIQMGLVGKITLMHLDDPQEIRPEDEQAAVNIGGQKNHIVYMREWSS